jgi:excisionase family DNA binding protein
MALPAHELSPARQERAGYSVREVAEQYGVSKPFVRLEIKRGNLRASKLGRRVVIPIGCVEEWVTDGMLFPDPIRRP